MSNLLPFLYISWPSDDYEDGSRAIPVAVLLERDAAVQEAWAHGWYPVLGPVKRDHEELQVQTKGRDLTLWRAIDSVLDVADAFYLVGEKASRRQQDELSRFDRFQRPVFATHLHSTFPERPKLRSPEVYEWGQAAERKTIEGWLCKTCRRFYGDDHVAERIARWCCVKVTPCDQCGTLKEKMHTLCAGCRGKAQSEKHVLRKREAWNENPLWCDAEDKWFRHLDEAIDEATLAIADRKDDESYTPTDEELVSELEGMQLLLSEPVQGRHFEPEDHFVDDLPEDDDGRDIAMAIKTHVDALNKAIEEFGPISYNYTDTALDVKAAVSPAVKHGNA